MEDIMNIRHWTGVALFGPALGLALSVSSNALADVTRIVVTSSMEIGPYRGREYQYIQGMAQGTAPGGPYSVPVELAFPVSADDFNGFALVDIINTSTIGASGWPEGGRPQPTRPSFGDDYLFGNGNLYVGILWDKAKLEGLGAGMIAASGDAYEIFRDAAALARDPTVARHAAAIAPPRGADYVIATGYSQTGNIIRAWLHYGLNQAEGAVVFDGALLGVARNRTCTNLATDETVDCDPTRTDGAKVISLLTETDIETMGPALRAETEDYRQIEVAGVSHVPTAQLDLRNYGAPDQNPIDARPVFRAALDNLQLWLLDTVPPPSIYIDIPVEPTRSVGDNPFWDATRDADGNALGGIRLPHMPGNREGLGAPLGDYRGFHEAAETGAGRIAGRFEPFPAEEIRVRYPSREAYVAAVREAAEDLVALRYILQEDADRYVAEAQTAQFWN
jgi:hypothetical protein